MPPRDMPVSRRRNSSSQYLRTKIVRMHGSSPAPVRTSGCVKARLWLRLAPYSGVNGGGAPY